MTNLIFINLYGNILPTSNDKTIRRGFPEFLEKHQNKKIAIIAYAPKRIVEGDLASIGLENKFAATYCLEDMAFMPQTNQYTPGLKTWAGYDFKTNTEKAICISSDPRDIDSSEWYQIKAVQIPIFENKEDSFSFDRIKLDSFSMNVIYFWQMANGRHKKIILE